MCVAELLQNSSSSSSAHSGVGQMLLLAKRVRAGELAQVHNDLKTKNILLSEQYETAKIGAPVDTCATCGMATVCLLPIVLPFEVCILSKYCSAC